MEPPIAEHPLPDERPACSQCGNKPILEGYPNAFCASCRQHFTKFPIPIWVTGFGIVVLLLVVLGLITFPKQISTGLHFKRAELAAADKKFLTAERELHKVLEASPGLKNAKAQLMIAAFYNLDMQTFAKMGSELKDVTFDDNTYLTTINEMLGKFDNYYPSDSFSLLSNRFLPVTLIPQDSFKLYVDRHPNEPYALLRYVDNYYYKEDLRWCDSTIHEILNNQPDYIPAIMSAIYVARMESKYDSALNYCNEILAINKESTYAISAKARIFMAQAKLQQGIELAKNACDMDPADGYSQATLALGYHLSHQTAERDKLMATAAKDSALAGYMEYVKDIVSGKEKFN